MKTGSKTTDNKGDNQKKDSESKHISTQPKVFYCIIGADFLLIN